jgi:hypothetical protein
MLISDRLASHLLGIFVFFVFIIPVPSRFGFNVGPVFTNPSELASLAIPFIYLLCAKAKYNLIPRSVRLISWVFVGVLVCVILVRVVSGIASFGSTIREIRIILPFVSSLVFVCVKTRGNVDLVLKYIYGAIISSVFFSIILVILPIGLNVPININYGRLGNQNSELIIYFLAFATAVFSSRVRFSWVELVVSMSVLIAGILSFIRTLLGLALVAALAMPLYLRSMKAVYAILGAVLFLVLTAVAAVTASSEIRWQVQQRIFVVTQGKEASLNNLIYQNREALYDNYKVLLSKYWFLGVPSNVPVSSAVRSDGHVVDRRDTDLSILTVWLNFGVLVGLMFIVLWVAVFWSQVMHLRSRVPIVNRSICLALAFSLPFYFIASLNIDVLSKHYVATFLLFILNVTGKPEKNRRARALT